MQTPRTKRWGERFWRALLWRLPILALTAGALVFYLAFPYRALDSDVATYGLMGNDILRHGYLPTLPYGQNYLFSITPYVYALTRLLSPALSAPRALAIAGSLLALGGLWLIYEALLAAEDRAGRRRVWPPVVFCLLIAGSWSTISDLGYFSSIEVAFFLLGVIVWTAGRLDVAIAAGASPGKLLWSALGLACGYACYSRPQMLVFGVLAAWFLLARLRRQQASAFPPALLALLLGAWLGYAPMLLHNIFRADWPFQLQVPIGLGSPGKIAAAFTIFATKIGPRLLDLDMERRLYSTPALLWVAAGVAGYAAAAWRRSESATILDQVWALGALFIVLLMILVPGLSLNAVCRRYCLHVIPALAWLFARFWAAPGLRRAAASLLVAALALPAVPAWQRQLIAARASDRDLREAETRFIPYLQSLQAPIVAQYWDAYLLAFLADGALPIEAYPWNLVRTYGLLAESDMSRRVLWLVRCGYGQDTLRHLKQELGEDAVERMNRRDTPLSLMGRECELWEFETGRETVALFKKHHPRYFTTAYPPGSRRASPAYPAVAGSGRR